MNSQQEKGSIQIKHWFTAFLYVGFIYATLGIVGVPLKFLRRHGLLKISLTSSYTLLAGSILMGLVRSKSRQIWKFISLFILFASYFFMAQHLSSPEEEVHFLEYGLVGILFIRALRFHFDSYWKTFFTALLLASLAGWIDELIQGLLPNRHYDVKDIVLNAVSALLGLCIFTLFQGHPTKHT